MKYCKLHELGTISVLLLLAWGIITSGWLIVRSEGIGGRPFSMAWGYDPGIYDPHRTSDPVAYSVFRHVCEPLFYENFDGLTRGLIAKDDFAYHDEGRRVVVNVRPEIYFHDGRLVDAYAIKQNFVRMVNLGISPLVNQFTNVKIVVRNQHTLEFLLPAPNYDFVRLVLSNPYAAIVSSYDDPTAESDFVGCTGPYKFIPELYWPDEQISLIRNAEYRWSPHYFENRHQAAIHQLNFFFESERDRRFQLLLNDELCGLSINADQENVITPMTQFRLYKADGGVTYLGFNLMKPRWQDDRIRRSIAMAIDKAALAKKRPFDITSTPFSRSTTGYDQRAVKFAIPYDPLQAKSMLNAISADLDTEIVLLIPESNTYRELADIVVQQLNAVGLTNVRVREAPRVEITTQRVAYDLLLFDYAWGDYTALSIFLGSGPRNLLYYPRDDVSSLIDRSLKTPDLAESQELILEAQRIVLQDVIWHPLLIRKISLAINNHCVEGEKLSPFSELLLHDAFTR